MDLNINNRIKCKCKGCTDRYIGCHGSCEAYKSYKEEVAKAKAYLEEGKEANVYAFERYTKIKQTTKRCPKFQHKNYTE